MNSRVRLHFTRQAATPQLAHPLERVVAHLVAESLGMRRAAFAPGTVNVSDLNGAGLAAIEEELQHRIVKAEQKRLRAG
ncbi:MAG TPA: hypothetical protein VK817_04430 [Trebonia sp.]|nr:hypothetical protein [Trebonia sp.]